MDIDITCNIVPVHFMDRMVTFLLIVILLEYEYFIYLLLNTKQHFTLLLMQSNIYHILIHASYFLSCTFSIF